MSTETLFLTSLGKYTFKKRLEIHIRQKILTDDQYIAENKYIASIGAGQTKQEALNRFEGHIDAIIVALMSFPESAMSAKSKENLKHLAEYIDLDEACELIQNASK